MNETKKDDCNICCFRCVKKKFLATQWKYWGQALKDAGICETEADLLIPETAIEAGAYILRILLDKYGDIDGALKHYSGNARNYTDKVIGRVTG